MAVLRLYLDMSVLKRPWDDQSQPRVAAETGALYLLFGLIDQRQAILVRSPIHNLENARNEDSERAASVDRWLGIGAAPSEVPPTIQPRAAALHQQSMGLYDALHFAWAEALKADFFVVADDRCYRKAVRHAMRGGTRPLLPLDAVQEARKWLGS